MAYNGDKTWAAGTVVLASDLQTYVSNNIKWLATDKPMVRCYNSANITTSNGLIKALTFDTNRFDNAALHSTSSNTDRITISTTNAGKYLVGAGITWAFSTAGDYRSLAVRVSGATNIGLQTQPPTGTNGFASMTVTTMYYLSNDYFSSAAQQNSGGDLDVSVFPNSGPEFWAIWVGI